MKVVHQIVGISVVIAFLLTGQFMEFHHPKMDKLDDGTRMMYRSRHIYILLAGLLNVVLGSYFSFCKVAWRKALQVVGSGLIIIAPLLLTGAFFYETAQRGLQNTLTLPAVVALFAGAFCHLLSGFRQHRKSIPPY
jgi:hypothetical protein